MLLLRVCLKMSLKKSNVKNILKAVTKSLKEAGDNEADIDGALIVSSCLNFTKTMLYSHDDYEPADNELRKIEYFLIKRRQGCPMAYLLGEAWFMGLKFFVNESTLIPRGDTEVLVEAVLDICGKRAFKRGLDIGTGSGAIAVSIAYYANDVEMTACDISASALETAKKNAELNGVNIKFVQSDIFNNTEGRFDFIVSNPPYIKKRDINKLDKSVRDYEPFSALNGGADGLDFYKKITSQAKKHLNRGGLLAFEIGFDQGADVIEILRDYGFLNIIKLKDLAGLDRVVLGYNGENAYV